MDHPLPYSTNTYVSIIEAFRAVGYAVRPAADVMPTKNRVLYLRHDVDYSLDIAVTLAEVNAGLGICGCFHLPVHSPLFNLASESGRRSVKRLGELGQAIALHFYLPGGGVDSGVLDFETVCAMIREQHALLRQLAGEGVRPSVSWHNPSALPEAYRDWVWREIPGLSNTYASARRGIRYLSDSNHRYTVQEWLEQARDSDGAPVQALFHSFQWVLGAPTMMDVLARTMAQLVYEDQQVFATNSVFQKHVRGTVAREDFEQAIRGLFPSAAGACGGGQGADAG